MSRIHKDIAKLYRSPPPDCLLDTSGEDLHEDGLVSVLVYLLGPESTPYYGGAWQIRLKIPSEYPRVAPKAWFVSKIFHPNVEPSSGEICVDTLKRDWSPSVDLSHILLTIRCLLIQPNPESALNEEAGKLLLEDYSQFEKTARVMTKVHSIPRGRVLQMLDLQESDLVRDEHESAGTDKTPGGCAETRHLDQDVLSRQSADSAEDVLKKGASADEAHLLQTERIEGEGLVCVPRTPSGSSASKEAGIIKKKKKKPKSGNSVRSGLKRL